MTKEETLHREKYAQFYKIGDALAKNAENAQRQNKSPLEIIKDEVERAQTQCADDSVVAEFLETFIDDSNKFNSLPWEEIRQVFGGREDPKRKDIMRSLVKVYEILFNKLDEANHPIVYQQGHYYMFHKNYYHKFDERLIKKYLFRYLGQVNMDPITLQTFTFRALALTQFKECASINYDKIYQPSTSEISLNLSNCTAIIGKKGVKVVEHDKDTKKNFITYVLPFNFRANAKCPKFRSFLDKVLPDSEQQLYLAQCLSEPFVGKNLKLEKFTVLYGKGANGKSVIFDIYGALMGKENVCNYSLSSLADDKGYTRAMLDGKLVNYCSELNSNKVDNSVLKQFASKEPVEARLPYGNPFIVDKLPSLIFNCNELPLMEHNEAWIRRLNIIYFDQTIPEAERNINLAKDIIDDELPGVFNWLLEGLFSLIADQHFSVPQSIKDRFLEHRKEIDSVGEFINDSRWVKGSAKHNFESIADLYSGYKTSCINSGYKPLNKNHFRHRFVSYGFEYVRRNTGMGFLVTKASEVMLVNDFGDSSEGVFVDRSSEIWAGTN